MSHKSVSSKKRTEETLPIRVVKGRWTKNRMKFWLFNFRYRYDNIQNSDGNSFHYRGQWTQELVVQLHKVKCAGSSIIELHKSTVSLQPWYSQLKQGYTFSVQKECNFCFLRNLSILLTTDHIKVKYL